MGTPSIGSQAKLAFDAALPFDGSSEPYEFVSENLRMVQSHIETSGIRGTRSHSKERVRIGREQITGTLVLNPSPTELDRLLPRILGAAEASDVFQLAETLPEFQLQVDRVAKVFTYTGCRVARATFRGSAGGPLELALEIEGETESIGAAGSFPAITPDLDTMYVFSDAALVLAADASAIEFASFELVIDNMLDAERYMNSVTRNQIPATDRRVSLALSVPYTADEVDLHDQPIAGAAGSITLTNGNQSLAFSFANLKSPAESPTIGGKGEIMLPLRLVAYKSGTTPELVVTHDSTV